MARSCDGVTPLQAPHGSHPAKGTLQGAELGDVAQDSPDMGPRVERAHVIPARSIKGLLEDRQWQAEHLRRVRGLPWAVREGVEEQDSEERPRHIHFSDPVEKMEPRGGDSSSDSIAKLGSSNPLGSATPTGRRYEHGVDDGGQAEHDNAHEQVRSRPGTPDSMRGEQKNRCVETP